MILLVVQLLLGGLVDLPFFKDLVALIGALTSVPLSLTLPAILWRRARSIALLLPDFCRCRGSGSYLLLWYSFAFLARTQQEVQFMSADTAGRADSGWAGQAWAKNCTNFDGKSEN